MNKKALSFLIAGCICCTSAWTMSNMEKPASALSIIASVKEVTAAKDVIAVGESIQLELEFTTGAEPYVYFSSNDENVATVDQNGVVTGVGNGVAEITVTTPHTAYETKSSVITITVSDDVQKSTYYNVSELTLGTKFYKYDVICPDENNSFITANIVNDEGSYDYISLMNENYVFPFDAELVGIDGLTLYIAPELDSVTYIDGRTLSAGDIIDKTTHLLCYDYSINKRILPVFLPTYYEKYIGEGVIKVKEIDHDNKTITLESVNTVLSGDIDGNGELAITDMVILQKWLLCAADIQSVNMEAADLCKDGKLNVFDLCVMKRAMLANNKADTGNAPEIADNYGEII